MCISYNENCFCGTESENMQEFDSSSGKWCCKETIEECTTDSIYDPAYCIGNVISGIIILVCKFAQCFAVDLKGLSFIVVKYLLHFNKSMR